MGMIRCRHHGLTHITPCCEHIGDAVDASRALAAEVLVDGWEEPAILCGPCAELAVLQAKGLATRWSAADLRLSAPLLPWCYCCLQGWYGSTLQVDLSETIARVRGGGAAGR